MTKAELHRLVDELPDESLVAAAVLLRRAQDPVAATLDAAPYDNEELTDEELRAVKEARSEPGIPWSDAEAAGRWLIQTDGDSRFLPKLAERTESANSWLAPRWRHQMPPSA